VLLRSVFLGIRYAVEPIGKAGGGSMISTSVRSRTEVLGKYIVFLTKAF
jgi:hypothetical protein